MEPSEFIELWRSPSPTLTVHTSGSTGTPKAMEVEKARMRASAEATCRALGLRKGDTALLCMPLDYIAGMMVVVRAEVCGLRLISVQPSSHPLAGLSAAPDFAAMVPLQVACSMEVPAELAMLRQVRCLIIGGGAIDRGMERRLRDFPNAVYSTYGMTETLSHIALRRLSGEATDGWYEPMEGVGVGLATDGCIVVDAPRVCPTPLRTNDIGEMEGRRFRILGRKDNVICSGGIKIQAEEVERLLDGHIHCPFVITRRPDAKLGEAVVLMAEGSDPGAAEALRDICRHVLPRYWQPKDIIIKERLPRTATGKLLR